jgi:hypothetical protein
MLCESEDEAAELADALNKLTLKDRIKTIEMYELIGGMASETPSRIIVSSHPDYHEGIIGISSS